MFGCALALALCNSPTMAVERPEAVPKATQAPEASMLLTGRISIDPAGHVTGYAIDKREKVPAAVAAMIDRKLPHWTFEPVRNEDGAPAAAEATMRLLVLAHKDDNTHYLIGIHSAAFDDKADAGPGRFVTSKQMKVPTYPAGPLRYGVSGTAYLVLRIDQAGRATLPFVKQVNLRSLGTQTQMEQWREAFASNTLRAAADWTFNPPTTGRDAARGHWDVAVPVNYTMHGDVAGYGEWEFYLPGPHQDAPWMEPDYSTSSNEALPEGTPHLAGTGWHLLTPLSDG